MKVIAYTALHYGSDYLAYAIRSVIDYVDEYWVLYSAIGSHGHRTDRKCPDSRETLFAIANTAAGRKLRWVDGEWPYEGAQRDSILQYAPDADVILVLDADEIWSDGLVSDVLKSVDNYPCRSWRVPIIHFWRSFHHVILHDPAYPTRVILPKYSDGDRTIAPFPYKPICHMGYAQRSEIVEYKQHTHGHKGEWRRDVDWFKDKFMANAQVDCHPVGSEYWNPETVKLWDYMPEFMKQHPYAKLEVIP